MQSTAALLPQVQLYQMRSDVLMNYFWLHQVQLFRHKHTCVVANLTWVMMSVKTDTCYECMASAQ